MVFTSKKKILITGATGYIGRHLCRELVQYNYEVFVLVRKNSLLEELNKFISKSHIIFVDEFMMHNVIECHADVCIHLAGKFMTTHKLEDISDLLESNFIFPAKVFEAAYVGGCRVFLNAGSYWQNYNNEDYNPVNYYAALKEATKKLLQYYAYTNSCYVITLKIFDTYGKEDKRRKILNILAGLQDGDSIDMTEGIQKMYFCHIDDIVNAFFIAMKRSENYLEGRYEEFFLRGEEAVALKDIVETYLRVSQKSITVNWGKREYAEKDILDPNNWGQTLPGWSPQIGLEEGLKKSFNL